MRDTVMSVRMTHQQRKDFDVQRWRRGSLSRAQYLRYLVVEDGKRLAEEGK